jgi:homoserine O-acetyltransferase
MLTRRLCLLALIAGLLSIEAAGASGEQQIATFPACPLASGESINDCHVGYRTFGVLNEARSNAVLVPTWFGGTTEELVSFDYVGPGRFADTDRYFIVLVDAFGNGVSSSPSNRTSQAGAAFPDLRIEDMVIAQHRLLTETLDIQHLYAVIGISMGGMQAFEWIVRFPDFMDKAVSVVGTPRQTSYDLLLWNAQLEAIQDLADDDYESTVRIIAALDSLTTYTPAYVAANTPSSDLQNFVGPSIRSTREKGLENRVPQLRAMIRQDISAHFAGSMQRAADAVAAKLLIVISPQDHMVNPQPSREFAQLSGATLRELDGACGHLAVVCDRDALTEIVLGFLHRPR